MNDLLGDDIFSLLPRRKKRQTAEPLSEQDESSVLGDLGRSAMSGVSAVSNLLDLPGSSARDLLAGKNPLDQWLPWRWTSDEGRTSGRDLLRQYGLAGKKDSWGNWFGGLATEIATDPLSFLSVGHLSKAGKAAQAAGMLTDVSRVAAKGVGKNVGRMTSTIGDLLKLGDSSAQAARHADIASVAAKQGLNLADIINEPLQRGVANFGLPIEGLNFNIGTGAVGKRVAGALDRIGSVIKGSYPGRIGSMLFDPEVKGTLAPLDQQAARLKTATEKDLAIVARHKKLEVDDAIAKSFEPFVSVYGDDVAQWVHGKGGKATLGKSESLASEAARVSFRDHLINVSKTHPDEAEAVSQVWKNYAEAYGGEGMDKMLAKQFQPAISTHGGQIPQGALLQEHAPAFYSRLQRTVEKEFPDTISLSSGPGMAFAKHDAMQGETLHKALEQLGKYSGIKPDEIFDLDIHDFIQSRGGTVSKADLLKHIESMQETNRLTTHVRGHLSEYEQGVMDEAGVNANKHIFPATRESREHLDSLSARWHGTAEPTEGFGLGYGAADAHPKTYREVYLSAPNVAGTHRSGRTLAAEAPVNTVAKAAIRDLAGPNGKTMEILHFDSELHAAALSGGYMGDAKKAVAAWDKKIDEVAAVNGFSKPDIEIVRALQKTQAGELSIAATAIVLRQSGVPAGPILETIKKVQAGEASIEDGLKLLGRQNLQVLTEPLSRLGDAMYSLNKGIPQAPFRKSHSKVMFKKLLGMAAEEGYDAIATPPHFLGSNDTGSYLKSEVVGLTPAGGKIFKITPEIRNAVLNKGQPLYQQGATGAVKAAVSFDQDGKALLHTFAATDPSSHLHEFAHVARRHLKPDDIKIANQFVGAADNAAWSVAQEEQFSRGLENYMRTGNAPQGIIGQVFSRIKQWMTGIYRSIVGTPLEMQLSPQIKDLYGRLIGAEHQGGFAGSMAHLSDLSRAQARNWHDRIIRMAHEVGDVDKAFKQFNLDPSKLSPQVRQHIVEAGKMMGDAQDAANKVIEEMGGSVSWLGDTQSGHGLPGFTPSPIKHLYRGAKEYRDFTDILSFKQHPTGADIPRVAETASLPTEIANQISMDPLARPRDQHDPVAHIVNTYNEWLGHGNKEALDPNGNPMAVNRWAPGHSPSSPAAKLAHAEAIAKHYEKHPMRETYTNMTPSDSMTYLSKKHAAQASISAIHQMLSEQLLDLGETTARQASLVDINGKPFGSHFVSSSIPPTTSNAGIPLAAAFQSAAMKPKESMDYLADAMTRKYAGSPQAQAIIKQNLRDSLERAEIPEDMMRAMMAMKKVNADPEWLGVLGKHIDQFNSWFKSWVYLPFPSSWTRNLLGGQFNNLTTGYVDGARDAAALFRSTKKAAMAAKRGDADIAKLFYTNGVIDMSRAGYLDVPHSAEMAQSLLPGNALNVPKTYKELAAAKMLENTQRGLPAKLSAVQKAKLTSDVALETGAKANAAVEWINRGGMFLYLTEHKGWTPAAAAEKVKELHFDYSSAGRTPFERQVASRLVPFYQFNSRMAPLFLKTLAKHPGGVMAQTVRAERLAAGNDPTMPDYVSSTLAIPNPLGADKPDGSKSYLTGFGLPFEQTLQFAEGFPNPKAGLRELAAQTTPLVKAPLEWATGQSFFQAGPGGAGRALEDLDPTIGRTIANAGHYAGLNGPSGRPFEIGRGLEFAASNSPASRLLTTARQLTDPRKSLLEKGINFGTGFRVTDISPAAQDAVLRQRAADAMKKLGAKQFEKTYFSKDDLAAMEPAKRENAARFQALMSELAKRAKERKKK